MYSKNELGTMNLQSVQNDIPEMKDDLLQINQTISSNMNDESGNDNLSVQEFDSLSHTLENKEADLLSRTDIISSENHLELSTFAPQSKSCQKEEEMSMNTVSQSENTGTLTLDTSHYYDNITSAPVMIYQMPCSNIVPFDSIVSIPVAKPGQPRSTENDTLLQNNFASQDILADSQNNFNTSQSWYIVNEGPRFKGQLNEKMIPVLGQLYSSEDSPNIFFDSRAIAERNDRCKINITDTIGPNEVSEHISSELAINNDESYNTNVPITSNIDALSASVYNSTDTDSEVALTLASLGNLKDENMQQNSSQNISMETCFESQRCPVAERLNAPSERNLNPVSQIEINNDSNDNVCNINVQKNLRKAKINNGPKLESLKKKSRHKGINKNLVKQNKKNSETREHQKPCENNLLGQLLKASKHCEPASLIPEGVVGDVIPAVGYRIMEMPNLCEMIRMMHKCSNKSTKGLIVMQEQASLREGAVSQLSIICTGCKEGAVCATSSKSHDNSEFDINERVETLKKEFNIDEIQIQKMLEILGIFYRVKKDQHPKKNITPKEESPSPKKKRKIISQKLECKICHKVVSGTNYLKFHMQLHDNDLHTCPYCQAYFKRCFNLKQHIKKHENVKFECDYCHKLYTDKSTLYAHIKSIHLEEYRIECEVCSKRFYHKPHYESHMRKHTKEKPFTCELCSKKFSHKQSLKNHMLNHKFKNTYKCRLCGKFFKWLISIRQHLMQQHKLKKSDTEAQVITDVIAEVLPSDQADQDSYEHIVSNESERADSNNIENSTVPLRNKQHITSLKPKRYSSNIDRIVSSSSGKTKLFKRKGCNIVTPSVAYDTVSAVYNPPAEEIIS